MNLNSCWSWVASWFRSRANMATWSSEQSDKILLAKRVSSSLQDKIKLLQIELESNNRLLGNSEQTVRERDERIRDLEGENQVLRSQIEMCTAREAKDLARLEAEAAVWARVKIRALDNTPFLQDELQ